MLQPLKSSLPPTLVVGREREWFWSEAARKALVQVCVLFAAMMLGHCSVLHAAGFTDKVGTVQVDPDVIGLLADFGLNILRNYVKRRILWLSWL